MSEFTVAVVDHDYPDLELERSIIEAEGGALISGNAKTEDDIVALARDVDGIINQYAPITDGVLSRLPKCRVVSRYGIGFDTIDAAAATKHGVVVCNVPGYCIGEVANHTVALMLTLARKTLAADRQVKSWRWNFAELLPIPAAEQATVGIVGLGNIGRQVAARVKVLGYRCVACDPYLADSLFDANQVSRLTFDALLAASDIVTLHTPLTEETHHLVGEPELRRMKDSAVLINTSRGKVVDQKALVSALTQGWIAGAGLDVLETEPPDPHDGILALENVVLTPHIAYYSETSVVRLRTMTAQSAVMVLKGRMPHAVVNPDVLRTTALEGAQADL